MPKSNLGKGYVFWFKGVSEGTFESLKKGGIRGLLWVLDAVEVIKRRLGVRLFGKLP